MRGLVEAREVEAGSDVGDQEAVSREGVVAAPADDAARDLDAGALEVVRGRRHAEDEDTVAGLGQGRAAVRDIGAEAAVEGGRHAVVGDRDRAHGRAEVDLTREDDAGAGATSAEGEVAVDGHRVGDGADGAVADERGTRADLEGGRTDGAAGDGVQGQRGVRGEHQGAVGEREVGGEGALAAQGQDAGARLGEAQHRRVLGDRGADGQTRLGEARGDADDGILRRELEGRAADGRHRHGRLVDRGDRGGVREHEPAADGQGRIGHRAFVVEDDRAQVVVADEREVGAAEEGDRRRVQDLAGVGLHRHRGISGAGETRDHEVTGNHDESGGRGEVDRAAIDVGRAHIGVGALDRRRAEGQRTAPGLHEVHGARERHVDVHRTLIGVDIQVRARRGERTDRAVALEGDGASVVGDDAYSEGDRSVREREVLVRVEGQAPAVGDAGSRDRTDGRSVVIVARSHGDGVDISSGEVEGRIVAAESILLAHRDDAEVGAVGRESRTVRDGPAADEAVDQVRGAEGRAVDLRQPDVGVLGESLPAEGVDAAAVQGRPTVEVHHRTHTSRGHVDVTDINAIGGPHADVGVSIDLIAAALEADLVDREDVVGRAAADEGEGAAGHRDRVGRGDADGALDGVQSVVIQRQDALGEAQARRAGDRAAVDELERAAADDGGAGVVAGRGQRRRGVARADEAQTAGETAAEGAVVLRREDRAGEAGDGAAHAGQRVGAGEAADGLITGAEIEDGVAAVEGEERQGHRAGGGGDGQRVVQAGTEAQRTGVDDDVTRREAGRGAEFHRAAAGEDEAAGGGRDQRGVHVERGARQDVEVSRAAGRTDQRAHVEGRGAALDEQARRVRERERKQVARGAVLAEHVGREARGERGVAGDGERIDGRRGGERHRAGEAGVVDAAHGVRQGGHLVRSQGARETIVSVLRQEARAESGDGGVSEDVAADRHHIAIVGTKALPGREAGVIQEDGRIAETREVAETGDDEGTGGLDRVDGHRSRRRGVGADDEAGGVGDGGDRRAGGDAGAAHAHARDEAAGAGDDDVGRGVGRRSAQGDVGEGQGRDIQAQTASRVRAQLDAAAAVLDREGRDGFGGVAGGGADEGEQAALHVQETTDARAETVVAVGRRVIEQQRAADVDVEGRLGRAGRDEGRAGCAGVGQRAAADGDGAEGTRGGLGRGHGQRAGADLVDQREGRVVEAHEATLEGRVCVVEADVERRGAQRAEDVAGAGEAAPGGVQVVEIEARAGGEDEGREARAGVGHAGPDAAVRDGEVGAEEGLGAEIEHAVAGLGDATGRADDGLEGERRAERIDVAEATDRDRGDVDGVRRGAEVDASFDERSGGDVGRSGEQAAGADGQDTGRASAVGLAVREGTDITRAVGAVVVERQLREGVVTEEDDRAVAVDGDFVAEGDGIRTVGEELAGVLPRAIDDETLGGIRRERKGVGGRPKHNLTVGDRSAAGVGVGAVKRPGVGAALGDRHVDADGRVDDVGTHHLPAAALGVEEELVAARRHVADTVARADILGVRAPGHEAAGAQGQGLVGGDADGQAGVVGKTQRVDGQVIGHRQREAGR